MQVVYNIFDQAPEDELFPVCQELGVAVIARVPFDEGSLTGTMTLTDTWPQGDWRNIYFTPENLRGHAGAGRRACRQTCPPAWTCPNWRCGSSCTIRPCSTVIPGMRTERHVERNLAAGDGRPFPADLLAAHAPAPVGPDDGDSVGGSAPQACRCLGAPRFGGASALAEAEPGSGGLRRPGAMAAGSDAASDFGNLGRACYTWKFRNIGRSA